MTDMSTRLAGVAFPNPVFTASGCAAAGSELDQFFDVTALGGVVTKSIMMEARSGRASTIGSSSASGGTGKKLLSAKLTKASHSGALRLPAKARIRVYRARSMAMPCHGLPARAIPTILSMQPPRINACAGSPSPCLPPSPFFRHRHRPRYRASRHTRRCSAPGLAGCSPSRPR